MGGVEQETLYIRMRVEDSETVSFEAGCEEDAVRPVGRVTKATPGRWVGVKAGLYTVNETNAQGGSVSADYFVFEHVE